MNFLLVGLCDLCVLCGEKIQIPLFHYSVGCLEIQEEGFHPDDSRLLAHPPPLFAIPDAKTFPVKPDLKGFDLSSTLNKMAESFNDLIVVNQAEVWPDSFDLDLDDLPCQA